MLNPVTMHIIDQLPFNNTATHSNTSFIAIITVLSCLYVVCKFFLQIELLVFYVI